MHCDIQSMKADYYVTRHSFIRKGDLPEVVTLSRLEPLLVRCGGCRFTAPAQDVAHLIEIIERDGADYVRDVSFPAGGARRAVPAAAMAGMANFPGG